MIPGFEDMTHEVNDDEIAMAHSMAGAFNLRIGKENAISGAKIISIYKDRHGIKLNDGRLRKIIQYIRLHNLSPRLAACSKGYFIANKDEEYNEWIISMEKRIRQTQYTLACVHYFSGQGNENKEI